MTPESKLENPARLNELRPAETLQRIGLGGESVLCDIGAGTGIFALAAASLTRGAVYALDIQDSMLEIIARKAAQADAENVRCVKVTDEGFGLPPGIADIALMCSMLHEVADKVRFLTDAAALLKPGGRLAVIEFHKRETPMGPLLSRRLGPDEVAEAAASARLSPSEAFDLGENFYCSVFLK